MVRKVLNRVVGALERQTFIKDNLVAKDDDVELAVCNETIEDVPARLAPGLDIQGTYPNDSPGGGLG